MIGHYARLVVILMACASAGPLLSDTSNAQDVLTQQDFDIIKATEDIKKGKSAPIVLDDILNKFSHSVPRFSEDNELQKLIDNPPVWLEEAAGVDHEDKPEKVVIFASRGMPIVDLKDMLKQADGRQDVEIVFRGIDENETFKDFFSTMSLLMKQAKVKEPPAISINPPLFKKYNVESVPQIFLVKDGRAVAHAKGLYGIDWIKEQYHDNDRAGDLGTYGGLDDISEVDLIELMKQRLQELDFEKLKRAAVDKYWKRVKFESLPPAKQSRTLKLDPSVIVAADIRAPDGQVIARAGEKINPLEIMPFTTRLLVFNPNIPQEVKFVAREMRDIPRTARIQLLATEFDRDKNWDQLRDLESTLNKEVYLLTVDVRERFNISVTPSVVYAEDKYFYVREVALSE